MAGVRQGRGQEGGDRKMAGEGAKEQAEYGKWYGLAPPIPAPSTEWAKFGACALRLA